ncbi:hypothetical protein ACI3KW_01310 [Devosia sp. ZW T5_3]|uniref:hypothetical protein n=1 Tax=Devosia sp. ZW T5_3 TaxID=3378085 RepID=UPI0038541E6C
MLKSLVVVLALLLPASTFAQERSHDIAGGQVSVPLGLTVQVKSVTVGEDATKVRLLASFDSGQTNFINLNDEEDAYLAWGESEQERIFMRQIADNKWMRISSGQSMEGDLVFPGVIPADASKLTLAFNPGNASDDTSAPGVTIPLEIAQ